MPLTRGTFTLLVVLLAWLAGCARSATVPPPAAISRPIPPVTAPTLGALPPVMELGDPRGNQWKPSVKERDWKYIVLHHTASTRGNVESIDEEHRKRKDRSGKPWLGIGYHFVIGNGNGMDDGAIEPSFRWTQQLHGAHAGSSDPVYNQAGIGIVLVGNFENNPPSPAQLAAVKRIVGTLRRAYKIPEENVIGHRDVRATACPGKLFPLGEVAAQDSPYTFGHPLPNGNPVLR